MIDGFSIQWPFNPGVFLFLLVLSLLYFAGIQATRRRVQHVNARENARDESRDYDGDGRGRVVMPLQRRHIVSFYTGIALAALLMLTPIDTIARSQLFTVHIAQLVVLMTLCSPLMLSACPEAFLKPFIDVPVVHEIVWVLTRPVVASLIFNLAFLLWHTPALLRASIENNTLYNVQIVTIFAASFLNWWPLVGTVRELRKMGYPAQILFAFFDGQPVDILAFVLVFTEVSLYPYYNIPPQLHLAPGINLTRFADQAAGGALLLIPGIVDLVVMTPLFFKWFNLMEQRTRLADERRLRYTEEDDEEYDEEEGEEYEDEYEGNGVKRYREI